MNELGTEKQREEGEKGEEEEEEKKEKKKGKQRKIKRPPKLVLGDGTDGEKIENYGKTMMDILQEKMIAIFFFIHDARKRIGLYYD